jgi:hypothetical protein
MAGKAEPDLETEIDDLYGLGLEEFTKARDTLAKRLRGEKRREEAQAVASLQKPNRTAWTINRVFRDQAATFEALFAAGERARAAQLMAFAGGRPEPLRDALADEAHAIGALTKAARETLEEAGYGADGPQLQPVEETLRALARRPDGRALLDRGRLVREVDPPGFEVFAGLQTPLPQKAPARGTPAREEAPERQPERKHRTKEEEEEAARKAAGDKRRAEIAAARARKAEGKLRGEERTHEAARKTEEKRLPEQTRQAADKRRIEDKRRAEEEEQEAARKAEEKRLAEQTRQAADKRRIEDKRRAEEARKRLIELRDQVKVAKAEVARHAEQAGALETSARETARLAKEAAKEAERARKEVERAKRAEEQAQGALAIARHEAERTQKRAQAAEEELERAREALAALERDLEAQKA